MVASVILLSAAWPARVKAAPAEAPATFVTRIVGLVVADDYARAWESLYPAHQSVAPRAEYTTCELRTPVGWTLSSATVVRVVEKLRRIPGEHGRVPVTLVTLRLGISNPSLRARGGFTHTFTAVTVGSRWTWILTPSRYGLYRTDSCAREYSPVQQTRT